MRALAPCSFSFLLFLGTTGCLTPEDTDPSESETSEPSESDEESEESESEESESETESDSPAPRTGDAEPNDGPASAVDLGLWQIGDMSDFDGDITAYDRDWYSFEMATYSSLTLNTAAVTSGIDVDTRINLYRDSDTNNPVVIAQDVGWDTLSVVDIAPGDYFIEIVETEGSDATGDYNFGWDVQALGPNSCDPASTLNTCANDMLTSCEPTQFYGALSDARCMIGCNTAGDDCEFILGETEPNDASGEALGSLNHTDTSEMAGSIGTAGDIDRYNVTLVDDSLLTATTSSQTGGTAIDLQLDLYNATDMATPVLTQSGTWPSAIVNLPAGDYVIQLGALDGTSTGDYVVDVQVDPNGAGTCNPDTYAGTCANDLATACEPDGIAYGVEVTGISCIIGCNAAADACEPVPFAGEVNDSALTAYDAGMAGVGDLVFVDAMIDTVGDEDWFKIELTEPGFVTFAVDQALEQTGAMPNLDLDLYIEADTTNRVAWVEGLAGPWNASIDLDAGIYFIALRNPTSNTGYFNVSTLIDPLTTGYCAASTYTDTCSAGIWDTCEVSAVGIGLENTYECLLGCDVSGTECQPWIDEVEPNDSDLDALDMGTFFEGDVRGYQGEINPSTDEDWYEFTVTADTALTFTTAAGADPGLTVDTHVAFYAAGAPTVVLAEFDTVGDYESRTYEVGAGTYNVVISNPSGGPGGYYSLVVEGTEHCDPLTFASTCTADVANVCEPLVSIYVPQDVFCPNGCNAAGTDCEPPPPETEPNDTSATAQNVGVLNLNDIVAYSGSIDPAGESDFWEVEAGAAGSLNVVVRANVSSDPLDAYLDFHLEQSGTSGFIYIGTVDSNGDGGDEGGAVSVQAGDKIQVDLTDYDAAATGDYEIEIYLLP